MTKQQTDTEGPPPFATSKDLADLDLTALRNLYDALRRSIDSLLDFANHDDNGPSSPEMHLANNLLIPPLDQALKLCVDAVRNIEVQGRTDRERRARLLYDYAIDFDTTDRATHRILLEALSAIADQPHSPELDKAIDGEEADWRSNLGSD